MKKYLLLLIIIVCSLSGSDSLWAQSNNNRKKPHRSFEDFLNEKTAFIMREMKLDSSDSVAFVTIYRDLQHKKGALMYKYSNARRELYRAKRRGNQEIPDSLYRNAVRAELQMNLEDAQLELEFMDQFEKVLPVKKMNDYMRAEKKFKSMMVNPKHRKK